MLDLQTIEDLEEPYVFCVTAGDEIVFGKIYTPEGHRMYGEWDGKIELFSLIQKLQKDLGQEVQTTKSIKADFKAYTERNNAQR